MARSAASIQAEIDRIEAVLSSADGTIASAGADGVSAQRVNYAAMTARLDRLYQQLGRANGSAPMIVRGRVDGLSY